jgi:hypothetical protein
MHKNNNKNIILIITKTYNKDLKLYMPLNNKSYHLNTIYMTCFFLCANSINSNVPLKDSSFLRTEVLTAVHMKVTEEWDVTPFSLYKFSCVQILSRLHFAHFDSNLFLLLISIVFHDIFIFLCLFFKYVPASFFIVVAAT